MGNYSNSEMMLKSKVLPTHAYHPNAALLAARRPGYVAMPECTKCEKQSAA
mgnify:CR=1 FL=1